MALSPSLDAPSPAGEPWSFRAHPEVARVRLAWRDPGVVGRPVEVHAIPAAGATGGWSPDDRSLLGIAAEQRFVHTGLGPASSRWCYAIVPVGGDRSRDGAALSVATRTSVALTGRCVARVGDFDGRADDLALAPDRFVHYRSRFPRDVDFRAGVDEAHLRWPYLHPGPDDAWAGRRTHRFRMRFDLPRVPDEDLDVAIWLVDRHPLRAGSVRLSLNGVPIDLVHVAEQTHAPVGVDVTVPGKGAGPAYVERGLPRGLLRAGENAIDIDKRHGSWIAYDAVGVFERRAPGPVGGLT